VKEKFENILNQIYQNVLENYDAARKTNNLIALRNFLWNNGNFFDIRRLFALQHVQGQRQ
jgi:hypothetical protein